MLIDKVNENIPRKRTMEISSYLYIAIGIMALFTLPCYLTGVRDFMFYGGSGGGRVPLITSPNPAFGLGLCLLMVAVVYFLQGRPPIMFGVLALCVAGWLLAGRTVSALVYPDIKIVTGFYYSQARSQTYCDSREHDCERILIDTEVKPLPGRFSVELSAPDRKVSVFLGPIRYREAVKAFEGRIGLD